MAYYPYDATKPAGSRLRSAINKLDEIRQIVGEFKTMEAMLTGDGSDDSHYTAIAGAYGFASAAIAHGAFGVYSASVGRLDTDGSVSNVKSSNENCLISLRG